MKIEIIKQFRLLEVGKQLDTDREWAANLIEKGFAKSLEVVEEVKEIGIDEIMKELRADLEVKKEKKTK